VDIQHVNVKLILDNPHQFDISAIIPIFHGWIQTQGAGELLLDVADYRHVPSGPGIILIGHKGNYSVDQTGGRLGVRYNRKAALAGSNQDRLAEAMRAALAACRRLETDPRLNGALRFNGREIEVALNDRLLAPNTTETRAAADGEFHALFQHLFGDSDYTLKYANDPRDLFSVQVTAAQAFETGVLLENLNSAATVSHRN